VQSFQFRVIEQFIHIYIWSSTAAASSMLLRLKLLDAQTAAAAG
jgi:hypothetical protein